MEFDAYDVVRQFEAALAEYTGAPYVVTTNSGSAAILLALAWHPRREIDVPCRTYASVPNAVLQAGHSIRWVEKKWRGAYYLDPLMVCDSARRFTSGMYHTGAFMCVSFQSSKILGLEQGGAILHCSKDADAWLRRARFDGRLDASERTPKQRGWHCYLNPSTAALGLQRLASLPRENPDQCGAEAFEDLSGLGIWA